MYTLRRISTEGVEMNFNLGNQYTLFTKEKSLESFNKCVGEIFTESAHQDSLKQAEDLEIYAFIAAENGAENYPLYANQRSYIMTAQGQTFDNISFK
jgi:hypothetical protein